MKIDMKGWKFKSVLSVFTLVCIFCCNLIVVSQSQYLQTFEVPLTKADSVYASKLPELKLPKAYISRGAADLPSSLNNAELPYFRPNFSQNPFWNCGQSAGIGYNFCYEMNCARQLPGNVPENQASVHFTFNFMNTGDGWGVSYFHSFDVLKTCGNPNLADYGGLFNGGDTRWMSGYELYENAMLNRIREVYTIDVSTSNGLLTLKHWLNDHLDGSPDGGTANFYLSSYNAATLPDDSPEGGQPVMIVSYAPASHAMTITGYNDSIRYDLNLDGRYTNDEDINNDGVVNMKDWEIGGLRFMNSSTFNGGYGLILYHVLALEYGQGGIWNQQVHVVTVKDGYEPHATMRVKIKHDSRNKLKLIAGVSQDLLSGSPQHSMDFPIFSYQGGDHYMQGFDFNESDKTIELSLDISPLLSFIEPGSEAKYFLQIAEKDKSDIGAGEVLYFSVIDFKNSMIEKVSDQFPKPIANNSLTSLSLISRINFEKVEITTEELLTVIPGEYSTAQLSASGGQPPYNWDVMLPYSLVSASLDFPEERHEQLLFVDNNTASVEVDLPFKFPFYNDTVNTISVNIDGFIMFDNEPYPYPYFIGEETMLKKRKAIGPFMAELILNLQKNDGVWVNKFDDYVEVIWKASIEAYEFNSELNFAVKLFADGTIETHYGDMRFPELKIWSSGVSNGDEMNYTSNSFYNQIGDHSYEAYTYNMPKNLPDVLEVNQNGLLSILLPDDSNIVDIVVQVRDDNGFVDQKKFQAPSELLFEYEVLAGDDDKINYSDTVSVKFIVRNISAENYHNVELNFSTPDSYYSLLKNKAIIGSLNSQQSITIDSAMVLFAYPGIPDQTITNISCAVSCDEKQWNSNIYLLAYSPDFKIVKMEVIDNQNGFLEPGEQAELKFKITNSGHMNIDDVEVELGSVESLLKIQDPKVTIDRLAIQDTATISFIVETNKNIAPGTKAEIHLNISNNDYPIAILKRELLIGKIPVLILDLDPKQISGPLIRDILDSLQLNVTYTNFNTEDYDGYMSVFICLGRKFNNVELSTYQANKLSSFLTNGGKIYMEGRVTWFEDEPTSLHEKFNIETISNGNYFEFDSIYGVTDGFTDGKTFGYFSPVPYSNYYLSATGNAFPILYSGMSDSACVVAYNEGSYKTVGSSIEFGGLVDIDSISTKANYLLDILEFFDISDYVLSEREIEYPSVEAFRIEVYPNPFRNKITIEIPNTTDGSQYLQIFDLTGRKVYEKQLSNTGQTEGLFTTSWDGKDQSGRELPKGLYFIRFKSTAHSAVTKILYH